MIDLTDEIVLKLLGDFSDAVLALQPKGWIGEISFRIIRNQGLIVYMIVGEENQGIRMTR